MHFYKLHIYHSFSFYSQSGPIIIWIHMKCNGGSYGPLKIVSARNSIVSTTDWKDNLEIVTLGVDKDQYRWCCFWITWYSRLWKGILDIKIIYQRLFFYSIWAYIIFWGGSHDSYSRIIICYHLWVEKILVGIRLFVYGDSFRTRSLFVS